MFSPDRSICVNSVLPDLDEIIKVVSPSCIVCVCACAIKVKKSMRGRGRAQKELE